MENFIYLHYSSRVFRQATLQLAITLKINSGESHALRSLPGVHLQTPRKNWPFLRSQWGRLCLSFPVSAGSPQGSEGPLTGTPSCSLGGPRPLQRLSHGSRSRASALQPGPQAAVSPGLAARSLQAPRWLEPAAASAPPRSRSPPGLSPSPRSQPPAAATRSPSPAAASTSSGGPRAAPRPRGRARP